MMVKRFLSLHYCDFLAFTHVGCGEAGTPIHCLSFFLLFDSRFFGLVHFFYRHVGKRCPQSCSKVSNAPILCWSMANTSHGHAQRLRSFHPSNARLPSEIQDVFSWRIIICSRPALLYGGLDHTMHFVLIERVHDSHRAYLIRQAIMCELSLPELVSDTS